MADSGFTELHSGAPVPLATNPRKIQPVVPSLSATAPVVPGDALRLFVNDRMNSRVGFSLPAGTLTSQHETALEPGFGPAFIMSAGNRVVLQGIAAQVFSSDLEPIQKITGSIGQLVLYPPAMVAYGAEPQTGVLAAFDLNTGKITYTVSLLRGYGYEREWFTRRGAQIFVASLEAMVDPHESVPELSTLEILQLNQPEAADAFGMAPSMDQANLIRKAQHMVAASPEGAILVAFEDHIYLFDWALKVRTDLQGEFLPFRMSLDELGAIYLAVGEKDAAHRSALWVMRANGGRLIRLLLDRPADTLIAPPIVGYDHTVYLLSKDVVTAVSSMGEVIWARRAQASFNGAVVTPDNHLVVSDGPELITFDHDGQRHASFRAPDPLLTPPLVIEGGKVLVASAKYIYLLGQ